MAENKPQPVKTKYLNARLKELGLTKKDITIKFTIPENSPYFDKKRSSNAEKFGLTFFSGDEYDNIQIHYFHPKGLMRYHFLPKNVKWFKDFIRTRLQVPLVDPKTGKESKYLSPKESGTAPFFPPQMLKAYINKDKITTLIVTEGEIKAFAGCHHGLNVIGIPSIHGFYGNEMKGKLHEDIISFITVCEVENVILLTDADTIGIKFEHNKDLRQRPQSFFSSVQLFRESLEKTLRNPSTELKNIYYSHIRTKFNDEAKGLDDLLVKFKGKEDKIRKDILEFQFSSKYFKTYIINEGALSTIRKDFGLDNESSFYEKFKDVIGNHPFRYGGRIYEYDGENVKYVKHEDTEKYMRIGADWFKDVPKINKHGNIENERITWKVGEITRDYKKYKDFMENIPRYDAFCSEPDFSDSYKREHNKLINIYEPCMHKLATGSIDNTVNFLKHIFGGKATIENPIEGDPFTVAMDYLTIQFQNPKQMLPVPVLVSKEYGTGKSTFLKWLAAVYIGNVAILNNELFKMTFNGHYITKYIIAIDEGFLDVDKKAEKERLKQLVSADTMYIQYKGVDLKAFSYYGKLIICSNDAESIMKMEEGEDRWFVIKVPVPKTKDPDLEEKLNLEISAWLYFLSQRKIFHPKKDRFWFDPKHIRTEQYEKIVKETKTYVEKAIDHFIVDCFLTYGLDDFKMNPKDIIAGIKEQSKYKLDVHDLKKILEDKRGLVKKKRCRYNMPAFLTASNIISWIDKNDRPYEFLVKDWLNEDQLKEFNELENRPQIKPPDDKDEERLF